MDILAGAGGHVLRPINQGFGHPAAKGHGQAGANFAFLITILIVLGQVHGDAQGAATGNNGDLVQGIIAFHQQANQGMACFVIGSQFFFILCHHHGAAFRAHHDLVLGFLELLHGDHAAVFACCQQGSFVHKVGQIGAGKTRGAAGDGAALHIRRHGHLAHMHFQDLVPADDIRVRHHDLAVKAARPQ